MKLDCMAKMKIILENLIGFCFTYFLCDTCILLYFVVKMFQGYSKKQLFSCLFWQGTQVKLW